MDLTFQTDEGRFNYRVCAIILHDEKILAMQDERSPYYYLPGGRVHLHETAENAILRELKEELGIDAEIVRPLWLSQSFFLEDVSHEKYHEICLYYLIDVSKCDLYAKGETFLLQENHHLHKFEWLYICTLETTYFYPSFLKKKQLELPETLTILSEYI